MKRYGRLLLIMAAASLHAATTVTGTLTVPTGDLLSGTCAITAVQSFTTPSGPRVVQGARVNVTFTAGALSVALTPTDTGVPGPQYYSVLCAAALQTVGTSPNTRQAGPATWGPKIWVVPTSPSTVDIGAVEVSVAPTPSMLLLLSQLAQGGASTGDLMAWNGTAWLPGTTLTGSFTLTGYWNFLNGSLRAPEKMVAGLPSAAAATGKIYVVTDGVAAGDCTTGGGSTAVWCRSSGSAWVSLGGGGGSWGGITGLLSNQADLVAALALKAALASPVFTGQPTIPDYTLAGHSHQNVAGGGTLSAAAIGAGVLAIGRIPTGASGVTVALGDHTHGGVYEPVIAAGTTVQFWRGDKTWQPLSSIAGALVMTTGAGAPSASCTAPSSSNLALYWDSSGSKLWGCVAANSWELVLSTTGTGPYRVTGATGAAPGNPSSGYVTCYFTTSGFKACLDSSGNVSTTVRGATATANQFLTNVGADGIQVKAQPAAAGVVNTPAGSVAATTVQAAIDELASEKEAAANKAAAGGYASLDGSTKVPIAQVPTGSTGSTVPFGNDARFSDARVPTAPGASVLGGAKSKTCPGGDFFNELTTAGDLTCTTPSGGGSTGVGRTSAVVNFSSAIPDGGCAELTFAWTGVTTSDTVIPGWPAGLSAKIAPKMFVSAADTVKIEHCNLSGVPQTIGSLTYKATLAVYNLSGAGTLDFGNLLDGQCSVPLTFTLTGAAAGDPVAPKWPSTLEAKLLPRMRASNTDEIEVEVCNFTGGNLNPASQSFGASIAK